VFFLWDLTKAQADTTQIPQIVITLKNGSTYAGSIISTEKTHVNFLSFKAQIIKIAKDSIVGIIRFEDLSPKKQKKILNPDYSELKPSPAQLDTVKEEEREDLNLNRLIIFPTARPMLAWQSYFQLNELFCPFAAISIDKFLILGGGASVVPAAKDQLVYFSARVTPFNYKNFYVAGGVFYVNSTNSLFSSGSYSNGFSLGYGMFT
jgi:hypothetical protein